MRKTALLIPGLLAMIACDTQGEIAVMDTAAPDYLEIGADATLAWDDPDYEPGVDRYAPNGVPIAIPLGTSNAYNLTHSTWKGESDSDRLGIHLTSTDVNGDGKGDLIAGSQYAAGSTGGDGAAYMNKANFTSGNQNVGGAKGRYYGPAGSNAGETVGSGGDIDGDGLDDLIVGGRNYTNPEEGWKVNSGVAYLVQNFMRGATTLDTDTIEIRGAKAYDFAGAGVAILGDINGDSYADFAIGATGADDGGSGSGAVYVFHGPVTANTDVTAADATIAGEAAGDAAGARILGIGDYDGDGVDDFAVGVRSNGNNGTNAGAVYVVTDASLPLSLDASDYVFYGNMASAAAGNQLAAAGDMDGDGYDDFIAGALGHSGVGAAFLVTGNTESNGGKIGGAAKEKFLGELSGDQFGASLAVGDINGDDVSDILIGSNRFAASDRGAVYGFYGPFDYDSTTTGAVLADSKILGVASGDRFGSAISYVENVDNAGRHMVAVGASSRGSNKGAVYLFKVD